MLGMALQTSAPSGGSVPTKSLIVAGAGPTGLAMALFALRSGLSVRIVDKAPGPSRYSKAVGLQYRVSELLSYLGLADRFVTAGTAPGRVAMYAGRRLLLTLRFFDFSHLTGRGAFVPVAIMIPQSETERLLGKALNELGCRIEWNTELVSLSQNGVGVTAALRRSDGSEIEAEADWLVGCDGSHSIVRNLLGLDFAGKSTPVSFVILDVDSCWPRDRSSVHVWFHRDGSAAAMPLPGARRWRLFIETSGQPQTTGFGLDDIRRLISERTENSGVDLGRCLWQSEFRINCRMVERLRVGRVFLAGDAAHIHSPTGGQGIATGLQDAANLAWKLGQVRRGGPAELLDSYAAERLPQIRRVLAETDRNTNLFVAPNPALRLLRDQIVLPLLRRAATQRRLVRKLSQLDVTYRASVLSRHHDTHWWRGGTRLRAGDRAPDLMFDRDGDNGATTLFAILQEGKLVALVGHTPGWNAQSSALVVALEQLGIATFAVTNEYDSGPLVDGPCPRLRDRHGELARLYGMSGQYICVIRPDGHVGLFQRPIRISPIRTWLAGLYPSSSVSAAFASVETETKGPR